MEEKEEKNAETFKLYDSIVAATFVNLFSEAQRKESIVLKDFDIYNKKHLLFLNVAQKVNYIYFGNKKKIKLDTNLWSFLKFSLQKRNGKFYYAKKSDLSIAIDIRDLACFMAKDFEVELSIFGEIYDEYYL